MYLSCSAIGDVSDGSTPPLPRCKRGLAGLGECELTLGVDADDDVISLREPSLEHSHRQRILEQALDRPLQRTCTERRIVALRRQYFPGSGCQLQTQLPVGEQLLQASQLEIDDVLDLSLAQRPEDDDVVDTVEKLRAEVLPQRSHHLRFDHGAVVPGMLEDVGAADVRRHDDYGVAEVDRTS